MGHAENFRTLMLVLHPRGALGQLLSKVVQGPLLLLAVSTVFLAFPTVFAYTMDSLQPAQWLTKEFLLGVLPGVIVMVLICLAALRSAIRSSSWSTRIQTTAHQRRILTVAHHASIVICSALLVILVPAITALLTLDQITSQEFLLGFLLGATSIWFYLGQLIYRQVLIVLTSHSLHCSRSLVQQDEDCSNCLLQDEEWS
jgi:hypothetical protein